MTGSYKTRRGAAPVDEWLTVTQAADLLGVAAHTLREWTAKGVVEASRTAGGHRRYRKADLERFRAARAEADSLDDVFHRLAELSTLADVSQAVFSALDLEELLPLVCQKLIETTGCTGAVVSDYDAGTGDVVTLWEHATGDAAWRPGTRYSLRDYPATKRVVERQGSYVANLNDPAVDPRERDVLVADGNRSLLVLPLVHKGETIGIVECVDRARERSYSQGELALARAICDRIALAVSNARLFDRVRRQNDDLELVLDAVKAIGSSRDLREALETIARRLTEAMDVAWCDIYDYDPVRRELSVVAYYQIPSVSPSPGWLGTRFTPEEWSDLRRAIDRHETTVMQASDPTLSEQMRAALDAWDEKSTMTVPLLFEDELIGALDIAESRRERVFGENDVRLVEAIAAQASTVVHNMRVLGETRRHNEELAATLRITEAATSSSDVETVLHAVVSTLRESLDLAWCEIYDFDPASGTLSLAAESYFEPVDFGDWSGVYGIDEAPTLAAAVAEKRPLVAYLDDPALPPDTRADMERWGDKASLYVPMVYGGEVVGVVYGAEVREPRRFTPDDVRLATLMAAQAAAVIQTARSRARELADSERLARFNRRLNSLVEFSSEMRGLVEVDDLVALLGRVVTEALELRQWAVYLHEAADDTFRVSSALGIDRAVSDHYDGLVVSAALLRGLIADATPISSSFFVDHRLHTWSEEENAVFKSVDFGSGVEGEWHTDDTLFVPMVSDKGQLLGYLEAYDPVDRQLPSEELVRHLEVFAGKAASTLELLRLYGQLEEQATTDGLTGLYNHRHLLERVEEEVAKARRYGTPVSLLMIDIDDFKPFNDTFGHPQGDKLLQEMADILRAGVRQKVDLVARYGGEEFVVLLPSTPSGGAEVAAERLREDINDPRTAEAVAEAIRRAMESSRFEGYPRRKEVPVTVSIGVASYPSHAADARELIVNSDRALYVAKRQGKNRTCVYGVD